MFNNKIKKNRFIQLLLLLTCITSNLMAQVNLSGFFDLQYQHKLLTGETDGMKYGQFEIGLEKAVTKYITFQGALAFNSEDKKLELGAGFADFHLLGKDENHLFKSNFLTHAGIIAGQFDVPFGLDYKYIAAPDRKLVSTPLIVEKTINCYNDFGINIYAESNLANFSAFVLNGLGNAPILGGRIGFLPLQEIEFGISHISSVNRNQKLSSKLYAADLVAAIKSFEIKGEVILADGIIEGTLDSLGRDRKHEGYYVQVMHNFNELLNIPLCFTLRYSSWKSDSDRDDNNIKDTMNRVTLGLRLPVIENLEFRLEYSLEKYEKGIETGLVITQLVVVF